MFGKAKEKASRNQRAKSHTTLALAGSAREAQI
jgi:hypothetical protein